jgi:hypothetical protein
MDRFRIVIAGSRSIKDFQVLLLAMDQAVKSGIIKPAHSYEIISGGAVGVDTLAGDYARKFGYSLTEIKPDYSRHGMGAPLKRNTEMAQQGDVLIAIWDGVSRGTQHMINEMKKLNKPIFIYQNGSSS